MISPLPDDFASKLLDKEIELESSPNITTLTDLVDLYRQAIEYYEDIKSQKFWDMQERLQKILMRPEILTIMREETKRSKSPSKSRVRATTHTVSSNREKRKQFEANKRMFNSQLQDSGIVSAPDVSKLATKLVENQESSNKKVIKQSFHNIKNQDLSLEERLKLRKQKILNTSTDSEYYKGFQTPLSPVYQNSTNSSFFFEFQDEKYLEEKSVNLSFQKSDELESEIEKIMEENFLEKTERVTAIKVKYESQINEFSGQGSFYDDIVMKLKSKMSDEIKDVNEELDQKRKNAISRAKAGYNELF